MSIPPEIKGIYSDWKSVEPSSGQALKVASSTYFTYVVYDFEDKNHDMRELNIYCGKDGAIVEISDYTVMNEFGSQRNEGSMRVSLDKEKAIELRDTLLNQYPIDQVNT